MNTKKQVYFQVLLVGAILIIVNLFLSDYFFRVDLTKEKRFTLSDVTVKTIDSLDAVLNIKVYLNGDFQPMVKRYSESIRTTLLEMKAYNNSLIQFQFIDPSDDADLQKYIVQKGVPSIPVDYKGEDGELSRKWIFPAAIVTYRTKEEVINLLQSDCMFSSQGVRCDYTKAEEEIEYKLISVIHRLLPKQKRIVGILQGHKEYTITEMAELVHELEKQYHVLKVETSNGESIPSTKYFLPDSIKRNIEGEGIDVLIVPQPDTSLSERDKYEIDQFIMRGGRVLWLVDQVSLDERDFYSPSGSVLTTQRNLNLDDLFFRYGFKINKDLIQDDIAGSKAVTVPYENHPRIVPQKWVYFPISISFAKHPVTRGLSSVLFRYASSIDTLMQPNITQTPLLISSPFSRRVSSPHMINLTNTIANPPPRKIYQGKGQSILSLLVEGHFKSVFQGRKAPIDENAPTAPTAKFLQETTYETKMIVVSDGGIVLPNHLDRIQGPDMPYDNKIFLMNCIDYLMGNSALTEVVSKRAVIHVLDYQKVKGNEFLISLLNMVLPISLTIFSGLLIYYFRKRKQLSRKVGE